MSIEISSRHPLPKPEEMPKVRIGRKGDGRQDAILKLAVGQSFFLKTTVKSASSLRWWAKAREPERDFMAKTEGKGCRIWRTK